MVERWKEAMPVELGDQPPGWFIGPPQAQRELLWPLDYGNPYAQARFAAAWQVVAARDDVRMRLLAYPMSGQFREALASESGDQYGPISAAAARLVQAVWQLGGQPAFERLHFWLIQHAAEFELDNAIAVAVEAGLDADHIPDRMEAPEVEAAIDRMMTALEQAGVRSAGPLYLDCSASISFTL